MALIGQGGWWGKYFAAEGGTNLVLRKGKIRRHFSFRTTLAASTIDGKPAVIVRYTEACPFPWQHIFDELRQIEPGRLLGMTRFDAAMLRGLALPFLLEHRVGIDGV